MCCKTSKWQCNLSIQVKSAVVQTKIQQYVTTSTTILRLQSIQSDEFYKFGFFKYNTVFSERYTEFGESKRELWGFWLHGEVSWIFVTFKDSSTLTLFYISIYVFILNKPLNSTSYYSELVVSCYLVVLFRLLSNTLNIFSNIGFKTDWKCYQFLFFFLILNNAFSY